MIFNMYFLCVKQFKVLTSQVLVSNLIIHMPLLSGNFALLNNVKENCFLPLWFCHNIFISFGFLIFHLPGGSSKFQLHSFND